MKKTTVRLFALLLSFVMCFSLAACGGEGTTVDEDVKTPVSSEEDSFDDLGGDIDFAGTVSGKDETVKSIVNGVVNYFD